MLRRSDVEARWRELIAGSLDRRTVHEWSRRFVEWDTDFEAEPLAVSGAQCLHGYFALGAEGGLLKTETEMRSDLERWLTDCAEHDEDPPSWPARRSLRILAAMRDRQDPTTRDYARACVQRGWVTAEQATAILGDPAAGRSDV